LSTGEQKELFPTGKEQEPLVLKLPDDRLALKRDEQTIFLNTEGEPTQKYAVTWSEAPICLEHDSLYLIALLSKTIEVRTIQPKLHIQTLPIEKTRIIAQSKRGQVYIASTSNVWCLVAVPVAQQIPHILEAKNFELALMLVDLDEDLTAEECKQRKQHIQNLHAFDLFCKGQFKDSMTNFLSLGTDPSHVIGLFPKLLPKEYRKQLEYPGPLPELAGMDLETGMFALLDYLVQVRHLLMGDLTQNVHHTTAIVEGSTTITSKRQLLQIIDTTLLKCYLQTNDALVAPLLRLKDNHCHVEESVRVLKLMHKYSELIILYQHKGLHKEALEQLRTHSTIQDSPLHGHAKTITYLQHLGREHLPLIFSYAELVLKENWEDGLKIFTEDLTEVESLPREKVLEYLMTSCKQAVIPYLEHVIHSWEETKAGFHNALIDKYKDRIQELKKASKDNETPANAREKTEITELRNKLIFLLETSNHYIPGMVLVRFPYDDFFEERAILMGKIGHHEQALAIYVHVLKDPKKAEDYCKRYYRSDKEETKDVYLSLLRMYVTPPECLPFGFKASSQPEPNLQLALQLLEVHSTEINPLKALELLPANTSLRRVFDFLFDVLQAQVQERRRCQVLKGLLYSEHLQVQELRIAHQSHKLTITDLNNCLACKKRIGNSAFARYPNGDIVHYSCQDRYSRSFDQ